ncbi:ATP-binding cassette domain-containing protein, partial [Vibrio parahaemolyticus]|nr:ATP-binding cassette domain-containing protein [Vibrio parahaemolyticus]
MSTNVVTVESVEKTYGKRNENQSKALRGVSLNIKEGEFVGIMGPSGSGKTTLLNVISTLDQATGGSVTIAGTNITSMKGNALSDFRSQKLGFIFQDFNLLDTLSIKENIILPLVMAKKSVNEIDAKVLE